MKAFMKMPLAVPMIGITEGPTCTKSDVVRCILRSQSTTGASLFSTAERISEASLLIFAGSGTTSTAISSTIFYMLHFPTTLNTAQADVCSTFTTLDEIRAGSKLNSCIYFRACTDEALRMSQPLCGLFKREIRAGGLLVDGEYIPKGTDVGTPIYATHHCEDYYPDSYMYKPERLLDLDEDARMKVNGCFEAFSMGHGCVQGRRWRYKSV
jgi:cytochrome P450